MVEDYQETHLILGVQHIRKPLFPLHAKLCKVAPFEHNHVVCEVCLLDPWGCQKVKNDSQGFLNRGELVVERKYDVCVITPEFNILEPLGIIFDSRKSVAPLVICLPGPMPYVFEKSHTLQVQCHFD